jgi:hypothetical protein
MRIGGLPIAKPQKTQAAMAEAEGCGSCETSSFPRPEMWRNHPEPVENHPELAAAPSVNYKL